MKKLFNIIVVMMLCESLSHCLAGGSGLTWNLKSSPPWGTTYKFDVKMGELDRWDSATQEVPPLQLGKAIQLAKHFMQNIPLGKGWSEWRMSGVELLHSKDVEGHEEWLYLVKFYASNPNEGRSGNPDMTVPVRMNGTIPNPVITKP